MQDAKNLNPVARIDGDAMTRDDIPQRECDYYLESRYPSFLATSYPAMWRRETPKGVCDEGRGVGPNGQGVYLYFADAIHRLGLKTVRATTIARACGDRSGGALR
jgi:succinate dehydrogenase / fumarate reductase, flavoprotein subunit